MVYMLIDLPVAQESIMLIRTTVFVDPYEEADKKV